MKNILILIFIILFSIQLGYCASNDDIIAESQTNKAKAETTKQLFDTTIGGSQYINYQWSLIAKETKQENLILRSVCCGLICSSIAYVGVGATSSILISGIIGYLSYSCINR